MASVRTDKQIFPFFDSVKSPVTASGVSESFHNNGYGLITIEVNGTAQGRVEGCVNIVNTNGTTKTDDECQWRTLGMINLKDFKLTQGFTDPGHYSVAINGMARVRVVLLSVSSATTVVGVAEA